MTTIYVIIAVALVFLGLVTWLVKSAKSKGEDKMKIKYMEAERDLREKMADVDSSADVDDPLSML